MPPPKEPDEPGTPRRMSTAKKAHVTTPNQKAAGAAGAAGTPKSAPAARQRSVSKTREPPTLLTDFLLGRPSPSRKAARKRRMSVDAVKAEMRQEMRQSSVSKLEQPGGVKDRVKQWQKTNAAQMAKGDPAAAPSEPTDIAFEDEAESVTEEDRVRIKMRQRRKTPPKVVVQQAEEEVEKREEADTIPEDPRLKGPPKKRVVSDDHWMKKKKKSPSGDLKTPKKSPDPSPAGLPKSFSPRTAPNPPVSDKIKSWAKNVEPVPPADAPHLKKHRSTKSADYVAENIDMDSVTGGTDPDESHAPSRVRSKKPAKPRAYADDGIRVTPIGKNADDDGIRVKPIKPPDDGIRVRPVPEISTDDVPVRREKPKRPSAEPSVAPSLSLRDVSPFDLVQNDESVSSRKEKSRRSSRDPSIAPSHSLRDMSPFDMIQVHEDASETIQGTDDHDHTVEPDTPTRRSGPRPRRTMARRGRSSQPSQLTDVTMSGARSAGPGSDTSSPADPMEERSDLVSSVPTQSLSDIPVGKSAFSEVDLPLGADAANARKKSQKARKPQRNPSFSAVPKVLKKVVSEGKKMIHDTVDPPKPPPANKPPSIETWLNNTVDPFVDTPVEVVPPIQARKSLEKEWAQESHARRRSSVEVSQKKVASPPEPAKQEADENVAPVTTPGEKAVVEKPSPKTSTSSGGLKRKGATRGASSPLKSGSKNIFRDALKDAFKGQSTNQIFAPTKYESREERSYDVDGDEERELLEGRRRSSGSQKRSPSPESEDSRDFGDGGASMLGPRRRPPTNGFHELSTIVSEESATSNETDTLSTVSQTTVTQTTAFTRESELSRQSSRRPGLKRRLTKHSDLVSALSLPDDASVPAGVRNSRSRPSIRRTRSKAGSGYVTVGDLMQEFIEDEKLYGRELKTLVDGVVPVLLNQVVGGTSKSSALFGPGSPGTKTDALSKSVISMGISLEKLRNFHRKAPLTDIQRLLAWLETVLPIYDSYLDAWRLGFEDLIVNLAPASGVPDDQDSLVNALPRNADGDVVNENGERVDVAHLLKRPILRLRLVSKFVKGVHDILANDATHALVDDFDALQEKARRRHREERARVTDEDAINTDTSRTRDLRTLAPLDSIKINPSLQVAAKDLFGLTINHSNGQCLDCQVELVHRDNPDVPSHPGDVLIRQTGDSRQTWLLFPPIPTTLLSARRGRKHDLVVWVRGSHNSKQWGELLSFSTDDEEQLQEWLDILGNTPVPPLEIERKPTSPMGSESPRQRPSDVPLGERKALEAGAMSPSTAKSEPTTPTKRSTPVRYHLRASNLPTPPAPAGVENSPPTPTQDSYNRASNQNEAETGQETPKASLTPNSTPYRADGAPPPPVHRTLGAKSPPSLQPAGQPVKRRTSSPLKHEYLPSDVSSGTEQVTDDSESSESSSDEIDSVDIPDTDVGISIKQEMEPSASLVSEDSLTPSNSASQAGLGPRPRPTSTSMSTNAAAAPIDATRFVCSMSHWYEKKGVWKDLSSDPCSIVVSPGMIEAFSMKGEKRSSTEADDGTANQAAKPLIALDLTPLSLVRKSNALDLEIRTALMEHSKLLSIGGGTFRFRSLSLDETLNLYGAVHNARLNNEKYKKLEQETRFKGFGERRPENDGDTNSSGRRRSWFGRKNSYRASARAPSQSQEDASTSYSSTASASSFLKRFTSTANLSFNIGRSSVEKQSQSGSGATSFYTSASSSSGSGAPRSPSISMDGSGKGAPLSPENIPIRLHLLISASKWEDYGNCILQVRRPPPGWRQELRANHGLEKRITVTTVPKKGGKEEPRIVLDAVLGSGCFGLMGTRGIVCGVWEELRDENGRVGHVPAYGNTGGSVKKWCFQLRGMSQTTWLLALLHEEVVRA